MMAVSELEMITTAPPCYASGVTVIKRWSPGTSNAIIKIRDVASKVMKRWGLTRHADLPPYPGFGPNGPRQGNAIPDFTLTLENDEILSLDWANSILVALVADLGTGRLAAPEPERGNQTPEAPAAPSEAPADPPVVLNGPDNEVIVWGKQKPPLPPAQYRVVKALVDAYASGERLSKDQLVIRTRDAQGNELAPLGALRRLRKNGDRDQAIDMAVIPTRGYSLKARPHTHPPTKA